MPPAAEKPHDIVDSSLYRDRAEDRGEHLSAHGQEGEHKPRPVAGQIGKEQPQRPDHAATAFAATAASTFVAAASQLIARARWRARRPSSRRSVLSFRSRAKASRRAGSSPGGTRIPASPMTCGRSPWLEATTGRPAARYSATFNGEK